MKVWWVLGTKGGHFPPHLLALSGGAFLVAALAWRGRGRFVVMVTALLVGYGFGWLLRRLFNGRDEVLFLLGRALSGSRGGYRLL